MTAVPADELERRDRRLPLEDLQTLGHYLDEIELDGDPTWIRANFVQGPKTIPLRYQLR